MVSGPIKIPSEHRLTISQLEACVLAVTKALDSESAHGRTSLGDYWKRLRAVERKLLGTLQTNRRLVENKARVEGSAYFRKRIEKARAAKIREMQGRE